jgi:hypothetical protein
MFELGFIGWSAEQHISPVNSLSEFLRLDLCVVFDLLHALFAQPVFRLSQFAFPSTTRRVRLLNNNITFFSPIGHRNMSSTVEGSNAPKTREEPAAAAAQLRAHSLGIELPSGMRFISTPGTSE